MKMADTDENERVEFEVIPPDGGWGWVVVLAAFFFFSVSDGIVAGFSLIIPDLGDDFQTGLAEVTLINSIFLGFFFLTGPIASALANRYGFQVLSVVGGIISAIAVGLSTLNTSVYGMWFSYGVIAGTGASMTFFAAVLSIGFYFEKWRALATGIAFCGSGVGTFASGPIVQFIINKYTWREVMIVWACLWALSGFAGLAFKDIKPTKVKVKNADTKMEQDLGEDKPTKSDQPSTRAQSSNQKKKKSAVTATSDAEAATELATSSAASSASHSVDENKKIIGQRPLDKDDIFYDQNLRKIHEHDPVSLRSIRSSIKTVSGQKLSDKPEDAITEEAGEEGDGGVGRHCCPDSVRRALRTLLHWKIMSIPQFPLFVVSSFVLSLSLYVPATYLYSLALTMGNMDEDEASMVFPVWGISNTIGRIGFGLLASIPHIDVIALHFFVLTFNAIVSFIMPWTMSKTGIYIYAVCYGVLVAEVGTLRSITVLQIVGLSNVTNAFGFLNLFVGIAVMIGPPVAGVLTTETGTSSAIFIYTGVCLLVGAVIMIPVYVLYKKALRKQKREEAARNQTRPS